nr:tripartite tricarboxylate transporter TctB family protein [uncultured Desulfobacter sp.]
MKSIVTPKNFVALFFILAGGFLLKETYAERVVFYVSSDELGPMTYPRYLLWAWVVLSVFYLVIPRKPFDLSSIKASFKVLAGSALAMVLYMVMFKYLGLIASTFFFFWSFSIF